MELICSSNIEPENRGFIIDKISAMEDGIEVGYLKIQNIPDTEWNRWYPSIVDFMVHIGGWCCDWNKPNVLDNLTLARFKDLAGHLYWCRQFDQLTPKLIDQLIKDVNARHGDRFAKFKLYNHDNPCPAYVRVAKKRQGIATQLYLEGAKWMAERGLRLRGSGIQTKEAGELWKSFLARGLAEKDGDFLYMIP